MRLCVQRCLVQYLVKSLPSSKIQLRFFTSSIWLCLLFLLLFSGFAVCQSLIVSSLLWGAQVLGDLLSIMTLSPTTTAIWLPMWLLLVPYSLGLTSTFISISSFAKSSFSSKMKNYVPTLRLWLFQQVWFSSIFLGFTTIWLTLSNTHFSKCQLSSQQLVLV